MITVLAVLVALTALAVSGYVAWPSRWNVPAHLHLGFVVVAYLVPLCFLGALDDHSPTLVATYRNILVAGAACHVAGVVVGARAPVHRWLGERLACRRLPLPLFERHVARWSGGLAALAIALVVLSFVVMGFVPMFAEDQFAAKFLRGEYRDSYLPVAVPYRLGISLSATLVPVVLAVWWDTRKHVFLLLALSAVAVLTMTLSRALAFSGVMLFVGLVAARSRAWFAGFVLLVAIGLPVLSAANSFVGTLAGKDVELSLDDREAVLRLATSGVPDVADHLEFLRKFEEQPVLTYGRTFFGGLVPFNYKWNPGVYTLAVLDPYEDVTEAISGGLRLPVAIWGYTAFSWVGALLVPLLSGFLWGQATRFAREQLDARSVVVSSVVMTLYVTLGEQLLEICLLSLYRVPAIAVALLLAYGLRPLDPTEPAPTGDRRSRARAASA